MTDELLIEIRDLLKESITNQNQLPQLLYAKHIAIVHICHIYRFTDIL